MTTKSSGFTLIELLVVVAIIGILSAIGVVSYQGYITSTKISSAKTVMQQIGLMQTEYLSSMGGYYVTHAGATCTPESKDSTAIEKELFPCGEDCGECEAVSSSHDGSSYIELRHNGYEGMSDSCDDSNDLLWLTVGHEFFHAVQHAYKKNASTTDRYYREFTSMWFEGVFVPACFDFLNFVDMHSSYSLFNHPEKAFDEEASNGYYGHIQGARNHS